MSEYAREYIENLNREYNYKDILEIAKVQFTNELSKFITVTRIF